MNFRMILSSTALAPIILSRIILSLQIYFKSSSAELRTAADS